jgi:hypothetical protein
VRRNNNKYNDRYTVYEATPGNVSLFVVDRSDLRRRVVLRIVRAPSHGLLSDPHTGTVLGNGSLLTTQVSTWPYFNAPLVLTYTGFKHYFNYPAVRYNGSALSFDKRGGGAGGSSSFGAADTFEFRAELWGVGKPAAVVSAAATQAVVVLAINNPPVARNVSAWAWAATLTLVRLNATDVDEDNVNSGGNGLGFVRAWVTRLPRLEGARLVQEDPATGKLVNVSAVPCPVWAVGSLYYGYFGDEALPAVDDLGTFALDAFGFKVGDAKGANSSEAFAHVAVRAALAAEPSSGALDPTDLRADPGAKRSLVAAGFP